MMEKWDGMGMSGLCGERKRVSPRQGGGSIRGRDKRQEGACEQDG